MGEGFLIFQLVCRSGKQISLRINTKTVGTHIATFFRNQYDSEIGTSASTPIVAALFNRIIEERLRVGKGPVGFVNPTLYQHPEALNDVVHGKNGFCCKDCGFEAAPGWVSLLWV